ncbi:MAG: Uma2 family endonuclease [Pseudanabaena sp. ELA748]
MKYDRETKIPLYTSVGIPEVWIVNIEGQVVEVYRLPNGEGYQEMRSYGRSETILLFAVAIAVDQIF